MPCCFQVHAILGIRPPVGKGRARLGVLGSRGPVRHAGLWQGRVKEGWRRAFSQMHEVRLFLGLVFARPQKIFAKGVYPFGNPFPRHAPQACPARSAAPLAAQLGLVAPLPAELTLLNSGTAKTDVADAVPGGAPVATRRARALRIAEPWPATQDAVAGRDQRFSNAIAYSKLSFNFHRA